MMSVYDDTYIDEMEEAMVALHEACTRNEHWNNCYQCPFDKYCDVILETFFITPDEDDFINFEKE